MDSGVVTGGIVLLGPPAAGKGTQAAEIEREFGIPSASTGAILRQALSEGSELGRAADRFTRGGLLVPDEMIFEVVKEWLENRDGGFVLDGFPRTPTQVGMLATLLQETSRTLHAAILLTAEPDVIRSRVLARRMCVDNGHIVAVGSGRDVSDDRQPCPLCGAGLRQRRDDTLEALDERMVEYATKSQPLEDLYRQQGLLVTVDANRTIGEVFADVANAVRGAVEVPVP